MSRFRVHPSAWSHLTQAQVRVWLGRSGWWRSGPSKAQERCRVCLDSFHKGAPAAVAPLPSLRPTAASKPFVRLGFQARSQRSSWRGCRVTYPPDQTGGARHMRYVIEHAAPVPHARAEWRPRLAARAARSGRLRPGTFRRGSSTREGSQRLTPQVSQGRAGMLTLDGDGGHSPSGFNDGLLRGTRGSRAGAWRTRGGGPRAGSPSVLPCRPERPRPRRVSLTASPR